MTAFPEWVVPMAATLTYDRFIGPDWVFERKFDGIRLLAFKQGADVRLFSRNRLPQHCPPVANAIAGLPNSELILDGEITWRHPDETGRVKAAPTYGMAYHVFDIMWLDGRDVTSLPLDARRALLRELSLEPPLRRVEVIDDAEPWTRA